MYEKKQLAFIIFDIAPYNPVASQYGPKNTVFILHNKIIFI